MLLQHYIPYVYIWKKGRQMFKMFFYDGQSMWPIATENKIK